ncbi:MAG TPA: HlyC/CorC family transporter [Actinobacteria bacterium]|nr:HlyC/CorC family transporter [Actinomycetota bacterium]
MADLLLAGALVGLVAVAAILGAAEAALLRVSRPRVEVQAAEGDRRAAMLRSLLADLPKALNTVLLVVLLVQVSAATIAGILAERLFGDLGATLAAVVLTLVLFVYGEAIPKTYAVRHPEAVARTAAPLLRFLVVAVRPVVRGLVWFADLQAPGVGIASPATVTEEELLHLVSEATEAGELEETDRVLIERVLELGDRTVDEIMTPRTEVVWVPTSSTVGGALERALGSGHRRLPVCRTDLDDVIGVVRLETLAAADPETPVSDVAEELLIVPESRRVVDVLRDMQRAGRHLAVVVDEYGGTSGIVTIEDVVAEVLGRVSDEGEVLPPEVVPLAPGWWRIDAGADLDEVAEVTGLTFPEGPWRTIGGLVMGTTGRIPEEGATIELPDGATLKVTEAEPTRIVGVELRLPER